MSLEVTIIILLGTLVLLLAIGTEVLVAIGITATIGLVFFVKSPVYQLAWTSWMQLNVFTMTAVPLFIFLGAILANSGVTRYLFNAADKWIGGLPGGLAISSIGAQAVFGAMCGSTLAAAATFTTIVFPEMEKRHYSPRLGLGAIAVGGILAPLIPPSIILIIYGGWQGLSIVRLFAAGLIPGIILAIFFMITIVIIVKVNPSLAPTPSKCTWQERLRATGALMPWLGVILLVLGAIFGGIMTPTEAAALGALLSLLISLAYRKLTFAVFKQSFLDATRITAMIMLVLGMAVVLGHVFQSVGFIERVTHFFVHLPVGINGVLAILFVMYLFLGMWFDSWSMLLLTLPFVMPVITGLGVNPFWWGIFYVIVAEFGIVTPPFGLSLFVMHGIVPHHPMGVIVRGALPFVISIVALEVLLVAFPEIALWLPSVMY